MPPPRQCALGVCEFVSTVVSFLEILSIDLQLLVETEYESGQLRVELSTFDAVVYALHQFEKLV